MSVPRLAYGFAASGLAASQLWPCTAEAADGLGSEAQVQQEPRGLAGDSGLTSETYHGVQLCRAVPVLPFPAAA